MSGWWGTWVGTGEGNQEELSEGDRGSNWDVK